MTGTFVDRVAIVTGAGAGLGRAYALELARRGAKVVVNDLVAAHAAATVSEVTAFGGSAVASDASVSTRSGGTSLVDAALAEFGRLDILISNAGILRQGRFEDLADVDIDALLDVHLKAGFYVGQPAFAAMKRQGYGRILFTSSSSGLFGHPWQAAYGAAKAGIAGLSNVIALEGKDHGIVANVILPNALTNMNRTIDTTWTAEVRDVAVILGKLAAMAGGADERLDPRWVVPLAIHLVSKECTTSHGLFSACSGRYARAIIGTAPGWLAPDLPLAEDIAAHWDEVCDPAGFAEPHSVYDEALAVRERLVRH
jgi:NAD(P)-dependent dehydrogenase (short-subunit alcohol dehydrogenase family)